MKIVFLIFSIVGVFLISSLSNANENIGNVFMIGGSSIHKHANDTHFKPYFLALENFPSLQKCKVAGFKPEANNFHSMGNIFNTKEEFEVCHFWLVASQKNKREFFKRYVKSNNLNFYEYNHREPSENGLVIKRHSVQGSWLVGEKPLPFGQRNLAITKKQQSIYGANLSASISPSDELLGIKLDLNTN